MKIYDTDEEAIALGERKKMLARAITFAIMTLFSGLGIWLAYTLFFAPDKTALQFSPPIAESNHSPPVKLTLTPPQLPLQKPNSGQVRFCLAVREVEPNWNSPAHGRPQVKFL